jgi:capsular polysaccharide biosynthesis protein
METSTKELESTILERNLETNQRLYDAILVRIKESNISGNLEVSNIRITEKAVLPRGAINQGKRRNVLMAALIGFMIGAGLAFLWEYMDRSLRSEEDIEKFLGLPVLSVIPVGEQAKDKAYGE